MTPEKTITLVWDEEANSWRDKHSNQKIAIIPPAMTLEPALSQPVRHWAAHFTGRELMQIQHAIVYARDYPDAGVPGHNQFLIIAKLAQILDEQVQS